MNITVTRVKNKLEKDYGYGNLNSESQKWFVDGLIKDTLTIVDEELKKLKRISIKK